MTTFAVFRSAARGVCDNDHAFCVFRSAARGVSDNDNAICVFRSATKGVCDNDNAICVFRSATRGVVPGSFGARGVAGGPAAPPFQRDGDVAAGAGCGAGGWPGAAHVGFLLPLPGAGRLPARRTHSVPRSERQHGSKHYTNKYLSQKLLPEFLREKIQKLQMVKRNFEKRKRKKKKNGTSGMRITQRNLKRTIRKNKHG